MQNTSSKDLSWEEKQEVFITSLKPQPLIVVLRPTPNTFTRKDSKKVFFNLLEKLEYKGINHIEIAWFAEESWKKIIQEIHNEFPKIKLGAASVNDTYSLHVIKEIGLDYAMAPFWDPVLIDKAKEINQLLIPGVFSPSEIYQAINKRCKIVKLFPASTLGFNYIHQLKEPISSLPYIIAAGGVKIKDIDEWLNSGCNAIAIGIAFKEHETIPSSLTAWINSFKEVK